MSAAVFWFTGLSGAGKTTLAEAVGKRIERAGFRISILDGDAVRAGLHRHFGFSEADIKNNNARIAELCLEFREDVDAILVPIISPYSESRARARGLIGHGFYEVFVHADLATVSQRDVKGLYAKAQRGEIDNLIGYSPGSVYEAPESPDIRLDTNKQEIAGTIAKLHEFVLSRISPPPAPKSNDR